MELEEAFVLELSTVTGLPGKIFPLVAPQGTQAPYLVYSQGANERQGDLEGYDNCLASPQYQLDMYHSTYGQLKTLKKQVLSIIKTFLQRHLGDQGPYVQSVEIITDFETYEDAVKLYKGIIEFTIDHNE